MNLSSLLSYVGVLFSIGLAVLIFVRDRKALVHRIFAAGMLLLAIEAVIGGIGLRALFPGGEIGVTSSKVRRIGARATQVG